MLSSIGLPYLSGPLSEHYDRMQDLKHKIDNNYRVRMVVDNMPVTMYDLTFLSDVRPTASWMRKSSSLLWVCVPTEAQLNT
jgi:hypothetical protein